MTPNRLQFQLGLSLNEFLAKYGNESQCEALRRARWPSGFTCPKCQSRSRCVVWHGKVKTFQCNRCHTQTTLTEGTIFHATKLPLVTWFQAMYFLTQTKNNVSALELKRLIEVCYRTAWRIKHKIIQVMCEREESTVLAGRVEIDDAYLGGQRSGGKVGRGSENKVPFVAAIETNDKGHPMYPVFTPVKSFCKTEISAWTRQWLAPTAIVVSDGLACFGAVTAAGATHDPQIVGAGRKSTDMAFFTWVNTLLSNIKTVITGTYHGFKFEKYVHRYLAEAQYRFNRRFNLKTMLPCLLYDGAATGKRTEKWLRLAEEQR
ncbi:MAG: IS1595 family transposase [Desulfuromonadales bacterium]|nr:IS1595 family transposase [Desulfuromonadales bacterium]